MKLSATGKLKHNSCLPVTRNDRVLRSFYTQLVRPHEGRKGLTSSAFKASKTYLFYDCSDVFIFNRPIKGLRSLNNEYFVILLIVIQDITYSSYFQTRKVMSFNYCRIRWKCTEASEMILVSCFNLVVDIRCNRNRRTGQRHSSVVEVLQLCI